MRNHYKRVEISISGYSSQQDTKGGILTMSSKSPPNLLELEQLGHTKTISIHLANEDR